MRWILLALALPAAGVISQATPVTPQQAHDAASGWLRNSRDEIHHAGPASEIIIHKADDGTPLFHVLPLHNRQGQAEGFVVTSSDDAVEPIIAFSMHGSYIDDPKSPAVDVLAHGLKRRLNAAIKGANKSGSVVMAQGQATVTHQAKWAKLTSAANLPPKPQTAMDAVASGSNETTPVSDPSGLDDVVVPQLLHSEWNQSTDLNSQALYNYYTPNGDTGICNTPGDPNNVYTGCVATAVAQIMRFWQWPKTAVGTGTFNCSFEGSNLVLPLRGGNGNGGAYQWANMPLVPAYAPSSPTMAEAIGALLYDAGVAMNMDYGSGGSSARFDSAKLQSVFHYTNAACYYNWWSDSNPYDEASDRAIRTSLDAKLPVGIELNGHQVVGDGYGYSQGTEYVHLNFGWGGDNDLWFNLPNMDRGFDVIKSVNFNIDPQVAGEIVAGRLFYNDGTPISGASVTLQDGGTTASATSSSTGIYYFKGLKSNTGYNVTVFAPNAPRISFPSNPVAVTTGSSGASVDTSWYASYLNGVQYPALAATAVGNQIADFTQVAGNPILSISEGSSVIGAGSNVNFGAVGATGSKITFTIENLGQGILGNLGVSLSGDKDFTVTRFTKPNKMRAGQTTTFVIAFTPQAAGTRSATVTIDSNAGSPFTFTLTGVGVPRLTVTAPKLNASVTSQSVVFSGVVKDSDGVARVELVLNGGVRQSVTPTTSTGNFNWNLEVLPEQGVNTATLTAFDIAGNPSAPITVKFSFHNLRPQLAGPYNGLIVCPDETSFDRNGLVHVQVTPTGTFTGKVVISGVTIPINGVFFNSGDARFGRTLTQTIELTKRVNGATVSLGFLELLLDTGAGMKLTGAIIDSAGTTTYATIPHADRAVYTAKKNPAAPLINVPTTLLDPTKEKGKYTGALLPPETVAAGTPAGNGCGFLRISNSGVVTFVGRAADGSALSYSNTLSADNHWPVFVPLYGKQGFLAGDVIFDPTQAQTDATGTLTWFKPASLPNQNLYPAGWPAGVGSTFIASKYVVPAAPTTALGIPSAASDATANIEIVLAGGGLPSSTENDASISAKTPANPVTIIGPTAGQTGAADLKAGLLASSGALSGSFMYPGTTKPTAFNGVTFQKTNEAYGFFLYSPVGSTAESGAVGIAMK
jgi:hypothetical protein